MLGLRDRPSWRTVKGGSHRYVDKLIEPLRLRLETPVDGDRAATRTPWTCVRAVATPSGSTTS